VDSAYRKDHGLDVFLRYHNKRLQLRKEKSVSSYTADLEKSMALPERGQTLRGLHRHGLFREGGLWHEFHGRLPTQVYQRDHSQPGPISPFRCDNPNTSRTIELHVVQGRSLRETSFAAVPEVGDGEREFVRRYLPGPLRGGVPLTQTVWGDTLSLGVTGSATQWAMEDNRNLPQCSQRQLAGPMNSPEIP